GLTLIPALFALMGRKAFWPSIPNFEKQEKTEKRRFWNWVGKKVTKRPGIIAGMISLFLIIGIINVFPMQFSFKLLKSFPEDMSSRVGFELLEDHYPAGELAPVTVILETAQDVDKNFLENTQHLQTDLLNLNGIDSIQSKLSNAMVQGE